MRSAAAATAAAMVCAAGSAVAGEKENEDYQDDHPQSVVIEKVAQTVHFKASNILNDFD